MFKNLEAIWGWRKLFVVTGLALGLMWTSMGAAEASKSTPGGGHVDSSATCHSFVRSRGVSAVNATAHVTMERRYYNAQTVGVRFWFQNRNTGRLYYTPISWVRLTIDGGRYSAYFSWGFATAWRHANYTVVTEVEFGRANNTYARVLDGVATYKNIRDYATTFWTANSCYA